MNRLRTHLSYANVCATLALFIALGGTGYAAITLPRNSVGSRQLQNDSVGTSELRDDAVTSPRVRDGAIGLRDLSKSARSALVGAQGPQGAVGPQGPQGAKGDRGDTGPKGDPGSAAVTLRAVVRDDTAVFDSSEGADAEPVAMGDTRVKFSRSVAGCVYSATLATVSGIPPDATWITVEPEGPNLRVRTYDGSTPTDSGFHLIVVCS